MPRFFFFLSLLAKLKFAEQLEAHTQCLKIYLNIHENKYSSIYKNKCKHILNPFIVY